MKRIQTFVLLLIIPLISSAILKYPRFNPLKLVKRGTVASEGQFPYLVSVQFRGQGHQCGGTIINNRWILTAAHCVRVDGVEDKDVSDIIIIAGTNYLNKSGITYSIEKKYIHEEYVFSINKNDIALLKVNRDIEFTDKVSPIEITTSEVPSGARVISGGWGESTKLKTPTNELQVFEMEAMDLIMCKYNFPDIEIFNNNICALPEKGKGTCGGDSGGPLVYNEKLVGVLSWGGVCGGPIPEVYSKVSAFRNWIDSKIVE